MFRRLIIRCACYIVNNLLVVLIKFFSWYLWVETSLPGDHHDDISATLANIGVVYADMQQFDKAIQYYKSALEKVGENEVDIRVAMIMMNLGIPKLVKDFGIILRYKVSLCVFF